MRKRWSALDQRIDERWGTVSATLVSLAKACSDTEDDSAATMASYLSDFPLDDLSTSELSDGSPVVLAQRLRTPDAPTVLVVGVHDAPVPPGELICREDDEGVVGPGVAAHYGGLLAALEGYFGLMNEQAGNTPVNLQVATLSNRAVTVQGLQELAELTSARKTDVALATAGTAWDLDAPSITTGARGHLLIRLTVSGGSDLPATVFAGSSRNPLTVLVDALAQLRQDDGRIALPGFYHRAMPASSDTRNAMQPAGYDPSAWQRGAGAVGFTGGPSALERSALWPTVDVLSIDAGARPRVANTTLPGSASATILFTLVPSQRPEEVEVALQSWAEDRLRPGMEVTTAVLGESDPHQLTAGEPALASQVRAVKRVIGGQPVFVPAGGMPHMTALTRALQAPVLFTGLAAPSCRSGTDRERVSFSRFVTGANIAGELFNQLGRPRRLLG